MTSSSTPGARQVTGPVRIGLIADTHGYFDPRIPELFDGVEQIFHAGDIGSSRILFDLQKLAPVIAVLGNNDFDLPCKDVERAEIAGRKLFMRHIIEVRSPSSPVMLQIAREMPDVVIFGHTHTAHSERIRGALFVNPGYSGRPRFNLHRSVAVLEISSDDLTTKFLPL